MKIIFTGQYKTNMLKGFVDDYGVSANHLIAFFATIRKNQLG